MATDDYWLISSNIMFIWQIFFLTVHPNGAINYYFDSAIGNSILSVHYQIVGGFCRNLGGSALIYSAT